MEWKLYCEDDGETAGGVDCCCREGNGEFWDSGVIYFGWCRGNHGNDRLFWSPTTSSLLKLRLTAH